MRIGGRAVSGVETCVKLIYAFEKWSLGLGGLSI